MKKFLMLFSLFMGMIMSVSAQTALVDNGTVKDNWYVGGDIGTNIYNDVTGWTIGNAKGVQGKTWIETQPLLANIYIGKMFNPYVGVEVDFTGYFNTNRTDKKFMDEHLLSGLAVVNLTNLNGYEGKRRFFEVELLGGAGWSHLYLTGDDGNSITITGKVRMNFNVSKQFAVTVTPTYEWHTRAFDNLKNHQSVNLFVGLKYRILSARSNFPLCKLEDDELIANLNAQIASKDNEIAALTKALEDANASIKKLIDDKSTKVVVESDHAMFTFEKGKSDVTDKDISNAINVIKATGGTIRLIGNTSPEGTEKVNKELAIERANNVKNALVNSGIDATRITIDDSYDSKRTVVLVVEK